MVDNFIPPVEGTLYRTYEIDDHIFPIYYGYYDESERGRVEPLPIFPDLKENLHYSIFGERIVTSVQTPCEHYRPRDPDQPEFWCGDCTCYAGGNSEIGICLEEKHKAEGYHENSGKYQKVTK